MTNVSLRDAAQGFATESMKLIEGALGEASQEVRNFLSKNGTLLVRARLEGNKPMENFLLQQLEVLGEVQRLRTDATAWGVAKIAIDGFLNLAVRALVLL